VTAIERVKESGRYATDLLGEELKRAMDAEQLADLDRAAAYARVARAIELGVKEPAWTGWTWAKARQDADDKLARAREHRRVVELAAAIVRSAVDNVTTGLLQADAEPAKEALDTREL
jgi:hypothetical protein